MIETFVGYIARMVIVLGITVATLLYALHQYAPAVHSPNTQLFLQVLGW